VNPVVSYFLEKRTGSRKRGKIKDNERERREIEERERAQKG
jgi:hypothetical protein